MKTGFSDFYFVYLILEKMHYVTHSTMQHNSLVNMELFRLSNSLPVGMFGFYCEIELYGITIKTVLQYFM